MDGSAEVHSEDMIGTLAIISSTALAFSVESSPPSVPAPLLQEAVELRCADAAQDHSALLQASSSSDLIEIQVQSPLSTSTRDLTLEGLTEADRVRAAALLVCEAAEHSQAIAAFKYPKTRPWIGFSLSNGLPELGVTYTTILWGFHFDLRSSLRDAKSLTLMTDTNSQSTQHQLSLTGRMGLGKPTPYGLIAGGDLGIETTRDAAGPLVFTSVWAEREWRAWVPRVSFEIGQASIIVDDGAGSRIHSRGFRAGAMASVAWRGAHG